MKKGKIRQFKSRMNSAIILVAVTFMAFGLSSSEHVNTFVQACQPNIMPFDMANKLTIFLLSNFV